uniref:Uncharacterized protein n=1 Tax=Tetraselmis sp. GSL018 TaxID=582737 RepID=A0A061R7A3_9CHLO
MKSSQLSIFWRVSLYRLYQLVTSFRFWLNRSAPNSSELADYASHWTEEYQTRRADPHMAHSLWFRAPHMLATPADILERSCKVSEVQFHTRHNKKSAKGGGKAFQTRTCHDSLHF